MTDSTRPAQPPAPAPFRHAAPQPAEPWSAQSMTALPPYGQQVAVRGPIGTVRGTGVSILLTLITFGIYSLVWYYQVHNEMKRHTGEGLGGGLALLIAIIFGVAMPYITSSEVGSMYERRGVAKPVSGVTGLWAFPGVIILIGPLVWFVKTNGALNAYWRSLDQR